MKPFSRLPFESRDLHEHTDAELLRAFTKATQPCQEASFRELVRRHVGMVHATALRITAQPMLAEEVAQSVFVLLAAKSPTLQVTETLGPWLHRVAVLQAKAATRKEVRTRKVLHAYAHHQSPEATADAPAWEEALPVLDEAIQSLSTQDRQLVILRYFQGMNFRDVGLATGGKSADAVRMQLQRALQRLCGFLRRRGVVLTLTAISNLLGSASSAQAAPALIDSCVQAALRAARVAVPSGIFATLTRWHLAAGTGLFTLGFGIMQALPIQTPEPNALHKLNDSMVGTKSFPTTAGNSFPASEATPLSQFLARLEMVEDEYQHPDLLAEAIDLVGQLSEEDFSVAWEKILERAGGEFKKGRMARALCTAFFGRWAQLAPALAFKESLRLNDERTSAMVVFETWVKMDRTAAEAAVPQALNAVRFAGHVNAWKRIARADPAFGLRLCLTVPDDSEKEAAFWQFMQWHSFMISRGYPLTIPGTERNFIIVGGTAAHPVFRGGDANCPGPEKTIPAMNSLPTFDVGTLTGSLLYVEAQHRGRTPENGAALLGELMRHLPNSATERAALIQWVQQEPLLSESLRQEILQHPAMTQP